MNKEKIHPNSCKTIKNARRSTVVGGYSPGFLAVPDDGHVDLKPSSNLGDIFQQEPRKTQGVLCQCVWFSNFQFWPKIRPAFLGTHLQLKRSLCASPFVYFNLYFCKAPNFVLIDVASLCEFMLSCGQNHLISIESSLDHHVPSGNLT